MHTKRKSTNRHSNCTMHNQPIANQSSRHRPRASHLTIPPTTPGSIVSIENTHLAAIVGLGEGVSALLAHALDLANLADGFLELLHAWTVILDIVFLDFLDVVVLLWVVHALGVLPSIIT